MPLGPSDLAAAVVAVGFLLLLVAGAVNRWSRESRPHLRSAVLLFGLYIALAGLLVLARVVHADGAVRWLDYGARLVGGFCAVSALSLLVVDVLLVKLGLRLPAIARDLLSAAGFVLIVVLVAADSGIDPTSAIAGGTVMAAALTISLQSTLVNVIGGVVLQLDGTLQVGDLVRLEGGREGWVSAIRWRHLMVDTRDGDAIVVPSGSLLSTPITLVGRRRGQPHPHRQTVRFRVDRRHPPGRVVQVVSQALLASPIEGAVESPAPEVLCVSLGEDPMDSACVYVVRYWLSDLAADVPVDSSVRVRIFAALQRSRINLSLPAHTAFNGEIEEPDDVDKRERRLARAYSVVRAVELFATLTEDECRRVAVSLVYTPFSAGEVISRQGHVAHHLYLLAAGKVDVRLAAAGREEVHVATLTAPGFFGEMGLLTGAPRNASIVAIDSVETYKLDRAAFEGILQSRPEVAGELAGITAARQSALAAVGAGAQPSDGGAAQRLEAAAILARIREFFALST